MTVPEIRYLVILGNGENTEQVLGPYKTESDAILAKNTIRQMAYHGSGQGTWGDGDTWVVVEERETITL